MRTQVGLVMSHKSQEDRTLPKPRGGAPQEAAIPSDSASCDAALLSLVEGLMERLPVRNDRESEQIEKLFACHLRLSRLSDRDVDQLVTKLAGYENERLRKEVEERPKKPGSEGRRRSSFESPPSRKAPQGPPMTAWRPVRNLLSFPKTVHSEVSLRRQ